MSALSDVEPDKKSASARAAKIFRVVFMGFPLCMLVDFICSPGGRAAGRVGRDCRP